MDRTMITRDLTVDEVSSTRLTVEAPRGDAELQTEDVRRLTYELAQWLLENDETLEVPWLLVTPPGTTVTTVVRKNGRHVITVTPED